MRDRGAMVGLRGEGRDGVKGEEEKREGNEGEWRGDEGGGYKGRGKRWR